MRNNAANVQWTLLMVQSENERVIEIWIFSNLLVKSNLKVG